MALPGRIAYSIFLQSNGPLMTIIGLFLAISGILLLNSPYLLFGLPLFLVGIYLMYKARRR